MKKIQDTSVFWWLISLFILLSSAPLIILCLYPELWMIALVAIGVVHSALVMIILAFFLYRLLTPIIDSHVEGHVDTFFRLFCLRCLVYAAFFFSFMTWYPLHQKGMDFSGYDFLASLLAVWPLGILEIGINLIWDYQNKRRKRKMQQHTKNNGGVK